MEDETIEVVPSEEAVETVETPSEPTEEAVAPAETEEAVDPAPAPELYELPDGRKVSGVEVAQEYKNLLSDYTRKSQELAATKTPPSESSPANPLQDYVPQTYEELILKARDETLREIEQRQQKEAEGRKALEDSVVAQVAELKTAEPTLNENALFLHATKYGFRDLKMAHQNMKDMSETMKKVQKTTADNIAKRSDPVSASPGATGAKLDPGSFGSAVDYLRALKGQ